MIGALGKVTVVTSGVLVQATVNQAHPTKQIPAHGIMFQAWPTNLGKMYIGRADMNKATGYGVYAILAIPTSNFLPTFSAALTIAPNGMHAEMFYVDADNSGEAVLCTFLQT